MSFLLCLAKLRWNLVLRKTPQETLLNTSVFWLKRGVKKNLLCVFHNLERRTDTPFGSIGKFKEKPDLPESEAAKSPHCLALLLSGMPGTGKTRLAKQIVTELSDPLAKLAGLLVGDALPRPAPGANGVEVGVDL